MDQQDYDAACLLTYEMFEAKGFRDARDLASDLLEVGRIDLLTLRDMFRRARALKGLPPVPECDRAREAQATAALMATMASE
jgi:hypothetical protein